MSSYLLAPHVFLCVSGNHVVFLDLKRDRYLAIRMHEAQHLGGIVRGWPVPAAVSEVPSNGGGVCDSFARRLVDSGLLTLDQNAGKDAQPVTVDSAVAEITGDAYEGSLNLTFRHVLRFVRASVTAAFLLQWMPIERVASRIRSRKIRRTAEDPDRFDPAAVERLITVFNRMRPFAFTGRDKCLFESLALIEFLWRNKLQPSWVFGIQTEPFAAHCWVQHRGVVLNDTVDRVRNYAPIMLI